MIILWIGSLSSPILKKRDSNIYLFAFRIKLMEINNTQKESSDSAHFRNGLDGQKQNANLRVLFLSTSLVPSVYFDKSFLAQNKLVLGWIGCLDSSICQFQLILHALPCDTESTYSIPCCLPERLIQVSWWYIQIINFSFFVWRYVKHIARTLRWHDASRHPKSFQQFLQFIKLLWFSNNPHF